MKKILFKAAAPVGLAFALTGALGAGTAFASTSHPQKAAHHTTTTAHHTTTTKAKTKAAHHTTKAAHHPTTTKAKTKAGHHTTTTKAKKK